jgi:ATP-dependent helicase HrpB
MTDDASRLRDRLRTLHEHDSSWPDVSDEALTSSLLPQLADRLGDVRSAADLRRVDVHEALRRLLTPAQRSSLDRLAPTHFVAPTGSRLPIDYSDPAAPAVDVRLQELFGCASTPTILRGVPLTLRLLSPAQRPVQVTRDLAGFWRTSYFDVRKDLRGRYPKHHWPDDPLAAPPTSRAKKRGR